MTNLTLSQLIKRLQAFEKEYGDQEVALKVCGENRSAGKANAIRHPPVDEEVDGCGIAIWSDDE